MACGPEATLLDYLAHHGRENPRKTYIALFDGSSMRDLSFGELWNRAAAFRDRHAAVIRDDAVCFVFLPQELPVYWTFFGVMMGGGIPSLMPCPSPKQHAAVYWRSHIDLIERTRPSAIFTDAKHAAQMRDNGFAALGVPIVVIGEAGEAWDGEGAAAPPGRRGARSVAFLQHSSGTTGLKKGVMLSHAAVLSQVASYAAALEIGPEDGIASWLPLYHDMGLITCTILPAVLGLSVTFVDPLVWTLRPQLIFAAIERSGAHYCWMPNFAFEHLARCIDPATASYDLSSMRAFVSCSEMAKPVTMERFARRFEPFGVRPEQMQVCYAMAETVFAVSQTTIGRPPAPLEVDGEALRTQAIARPMPGGLPVASTGRPIEGIRVTVRDGERMLGDGEVGEICVAGDFLFSGYYHAEDVTRDRLRDGVYYTRDTGFVRDGEVYVLGRKDDLIIVHGKNVYAHEVEALCGRVPGTKPGRAVAFGVANEQTGSEDLVVVAERDGAPAGSESEIRRALIECVFDHIAVRPIACMVVDQGWLLKTTSGKISRGANREKYLSLRAAG